MVNLEDLIRDLAAIEGQGEPEMSLLEAKRLRPGNYIKIAVNPGTVRCYYTLNSPEHPAPKPGQMYKILGLRVGENGALFHLGEEKIEEKKNIPLDSAYGISWIAAGSGSK